MKEMTSKERVRNAIMHKPVDRVPAAFHGVGTVYDRLMKEYGYDSLEQIHQRYNTDIRYAFAKCTKEFPKRIAPNGNQVTTNYWGSESELHIFGDEKYNTTVTFPWNNIETLEDFEKYEFPKTEWFDYSTITKYCEEHSDKAIVIGHEGPFQHVTALMSMDNFFMLMIDEPELTHKMLDKMVEFELEHYEKMLIAGKGMIDILRTHDDYGTQISLLFSVDMWREFFAENTKKLVKLAHKYGAFFQQHSCGAVAPIIPELIKCGVDSLEPLQTVKGLEPETLQEKYGGQICFHGGIDTQGLLPNGTPEEVKATTERYISTLNNNGGYILMASQGFENDVPTANIEAVYNANRYLGK